ncbi:MAG TPA: cell envelope integrity protein CreD [Allosphingosinicella sp.]|nr:cell envelope integrity protein CreD [Allosphingosinicella sp.]
MNAIVQERTPGAKLGLVILVAFLLSFPLFAVWMIVYDRQSQSEFAQQSIAEGWAGPQSMSGPLLVIPYSITATEKVREGDRDVTRTVETRHELTLAPEIVQLSTDVRPERRTRSIYEVVVYDASVRGRARFAVPQDLARLGVDPARLDFSRAELRFGLSDPRGLGANPQVSSAGQRLRLQPGGGGGSGFFAWIDAGALRSGAMQFDFSFDFRGNGSLGLTPRAGDTVWQLRSPWPHPSFQGGFLPASRTVSADGFEAVYRVGNLALGHSLVSTRPANAPPVPIQQVQAPNSNARYADAQTDADANGGPSAGAQVSLVQPVDLYSQVDRATKYGFLFIGFTFLAFLLFDVIGGVRVSAVEYLLVGAGLILFFVLLLAFAEVIGFTLAYIVASAAITGLNTAYSSAVLRSWKRAAYIGTLLAALYAVLFVLLSLEAYSLLIGSLLLFAALAGVMYLTRNLNWGAIGAGTGEEAVPARTT